MNELLKEFEDIISTNEKSKLERTGIIQYEIKVTEHSIKSRSYSIKDNKREKWMKEKIDCILRDRIIKKSKSLWTSFVMLVLKKDRSRILKYIYRGQITFEFFTKCCTQRYFIRSVRKIST